VKEQVDLAQQVYQLVIILTRMFKVGDTINVLDCSGVVVEITLATTIPFPQREVSLTQVAPSPGG
jgi:hypothetical protein